MVLWDGKDVLESWSACLKGLELKALSIPELSSRRDRLTITT